MPWRGTPDPRPQTSNLKPQTWAGALLGDVPESHGIASQEAPQEPGRDGGGRAVGGGEHSRALRRAPRIGAAPPIYYFFLYEFSFFLYEFSVFFSLNFH